MMMMMNSHFMMHLTSLQLSVLSWCVVMVEKTETTSHVHLCPLCLLFCSYFYFFCSAGLRCKKEKYFFFLQMVLSVVFLYLQNIF